MHPARLIGPRLVVFLAVVAALAASAAARAADNPPPARPNFVFIMADDLGYGDVGFHGGPAPTPHLDRLAAEGLELRQHYVAPVCSPTRSALLTGRYWSRFGVTSAQNERALPWDTVTLPRALKTLGYETCLVGKWHLGSLPEWGPNHYGFDHSYGSLAGGVSPYSHGYKQGPFAATWHRNEQLLSESGHVTDLLADEAVRWLRGRAGKPFFLYVPLTAIHLPIKEPDAWLARVPASITGEVPRHYAAAVMHLDDAVGRIVAALEETGQRRNTLLVFTSDNGGSTASNNDRRYPDDGCPEGKLVGRNVPWRGEKGQLYEGGIHVAAVASWPARLGPGQLDRPIHVADWMPTIAALAGYRPEADLRWDGVDQSAALLDPSSAAADPAARERTLYWVAPGRRSRAVRLGDWKLIESRAGSGTLQLELFDLARDPGETTNRAEAEPERVRGLLAALEAAGARDNDARAGEE